MMFDKKYHTPIFAALMAISMGGLMSLAFTIIMTGFGGDFFGRFLNGFILGTIVGLPISIIVVPVMKNITDRLTS